MMNDSLYCVQKGPVIITCGVLHVMLCILMHNEVLNRTKHRGDLDTSPIEQIPASNNNSSTVCY